MYGLSVKTDMRIDVVLPFTAPVQILTWLNAAAVVSEYRYPTKDDANYALYSYPSKCFLGNGHRNASRKNYFISLVLFYY